MVFDKGAEPIQWGKQRTVFSTRGAENRTSTCKIMKFAAYPSQFIKINSKYIKDLNLLKS